ncbi:type II secretion system F family protein [Candidatus Altiarchaeota archaeon]
MKRIYIFLSRLYPANARADMGRKLMHAGLDTEPEVWLGKSLLFGMLVAIVTLLIGTFGNQALFIVLAVVMFLSYVVGAYSIPFFMAEKRAESVEEALPSVLQLMASNVRAGMTPYQAMKVSARDEFGLLKDEIDTATTKALGSESFAQALMGMNDHIGLPVLERAIKLFIRSVESGGYLAKILEETARDINENIMMRKQLISSTRTYTILIILTIMIGMPVLMNISIHFTERVEKMKSAFDPGDLEELGFGMFMEEAFSVDFLVNMSLVIIIVSAFIASLLIGVIVKGKEKYGLKYAIMLVPASLIVFYTVRYFIQTMFL